jgi:hypothetical protein
MTESHFPGSPGFLIAHKESGRKEDSGTCAVAGCRDSLQVKMCTAKKTADAALPTEFAPGARSLRILNR